MMRIVAACTVAIVVMIACKTSDPTAIRPGTLFVAARDSFFAPTTLTIDRGFPIRWTNEGTVYHTVSSDDALFDSGLIPLRNWFEVRFDSAGTFLYHCSRHSGMTGTIIVQ